MKIVDNSASSNARNSEIDSLSEQSGLLRTIFEGTPEAIFLKNLQGKFRVVNPAFARIVGMSAKQIIGKTDSDIFSTDILQILKKSDHLAISTGETQVFGCPVTLPSGAEHFFLVKKNAYFNKAGKPMGVFGLALDITELKHSEQKIRSSEEELTVILNSMQDTFYRTDNEGRIIRLTNSIKPILGYTPEELLGTRMADLYVDPDGREEFLKALAINGGIIQNYAVALKAKDGSIVWVSTNAHYFRNPQGFIGGVEGTTRDITKLKRATEIRSRFGRIMDNSYNEIYVFDVHTLRFIQVNRGAQNNLKYTMEELEHLTPVSLKPDFTRDQFLQMIQPLRDGDVQHIVFQTRHQRKDKSFYPVEVWLQLSDEESPPVFFAIIQDITKRVKSEQALRDSEAQVRLLLNSTGEAIYGLNLDGNCTFANPACVKALGYDDVSEILGRNMHELIHHTRPDNTPYPEKDCTIFQSSRSGESTHVADELLWRKDGSGFYAEYSSYPIRNDNEIIGSVVTFVDTSERRGAQAQMKKLSRALQQTADIVLITNRQGIIEYVNRSFENISGYSREEALGKTPNILKSGKQGVDFYRRLWGRILSGRVFRDVLINQKKDGSLYYEEKTITPLTDSKGKITHFVATGKDITDRMKIQKRLQFMAHHDPLTELPNRMLFIDRLKQSLVRARWHNRVVAVLFLDLDRFKNINDTLGHDVGDQVLKGLGQRLSTQLREGDTVGRLGGDEFAILLNDLACSNDVSHIANKVLGTLNPPLNINGRELYITASIGISLYPDDSTDPNILLRNADIAMYKAKELGKNNFQFYSSDMSIKAFERLNLENSLRQALQRQEFRLHYQPQVCLRTYEIVGVEALLRWQHPDLGLVPPTDFVPILEDTGLIVTVAEWVIAKACVQAKKWNAGRQNLLPISINLSVRNIIESNFVAVLEKILITSGLDPSLLVLEITESIMMHDVAKTTQVLGALSEMGVKLAVDDFGTGYSSLSYLKKFPINILKIDRTFIHDIPDDSEDASLVEAILAMGQTLHLNVIAEGVETQEQLTFLRQRNCDSMQGFLYSQAVPAEEFSQLLRKTHLH